MAQFHDVKLELVRPGPPHNQLLSPLTPYMALCGEGSPITFHIDLEHRQLMSRLERLRYVTLEGRGGVAVPDRIREAAVTELGEDVTRIFAKFSTLLADAWRAVGDADAQSHLLHLRLVLSGSELALIPFEMTFAPQAFPGEGFELVLQSHMPVVLTREIRHTRPNPVQWDHLLEPRVLVVSAAPAGLEVPLNPHILALRQALEPWIGWPKRENGEPDPEARNQRRLKDVKERLRVLPQASIEAIYDLCSKERFTHVHILAHGNSIEVAGEKRFGVALCRHGDRGEKHVVTGKRLAKALQAESRDGSSRTRPLLVTLATCDSGNPGSVLVPGGSIAHDLHATGIPWVFASQFPLTKVGSVRLTEELYSRLLRGDDPRQALFEVRRLLHMSAERDHDWASLVAYVSIADDLESQVTAFFERQMRQAINVSLDHADDDKETKDEVEKALDTTRQYLDLWKSRLPEGDGADERTRRAEFHGIQGSTFKRIGLLYYGMEQKREEEGRDALEQSLAAYRRAMGQRAIAEKYHWVATQALSLIAVLGEKPEPETYLLARQTAKGDLASSSSSEKAWAHGTMAELEMLASYHLEEKEQKDIESRKKAVREHCEAIVELMGKRSFVVASTRRQFQRYRDYWKRPEWRPIAEEAVRVLSHKGGSGGTDMPPQA